MKRPLRYFLFLLVLVLALWPTSDVIAQCAMCKEAAESSMKDNPRSMARSLNKGILYLMAIPYLAIAFIFRKQLYQLWKMLVLRFNKWRGHDPEKPEITESR